MTDRSMQMVDLVRDQAAVDAIYVPQVDTRTRAHLSEKYELMTDLCIHFGRNSTQDIAALLGIPPERAMDLLNMRQSQFSREELLRFASLTG